MMWQSLHRCKQGDAAYEADDRDDDVGNLSHVAPPRCSHAPGRWSPSGVRLTDSCLRYQRRADRVKRPASPDDRCMSPEAGHDARAGRASENKSFGVLVTLVPDSLFTSSWNWPFVPMARRLNWRILATRLDSRRDGGHDPSRDERVAFGPDQFLVESQLAHIGHRQSHSSTSTQSSYSSVMPSIPPTNTEALNHIDCIISFRIKARLSPSVSHRRVQWRRPKLESISIHVSGVISSPNHLD